MALLDANDQVYLVNPLYPSPNDLNAWIKISWHSVTEFLGYFKSMVGVSEEPTSILS